MGRGLGEGSREIGPDGSSADDGKRFCDGRCITIGLNGKGFGEGVAPDRTGPVLDRFMYGVFLRSFV